MRYIITPTLLVVLLLSGCHRSRDKAVQSDPDLTGVSMEKVQSLLSDRLTRDELFAAIGEPVILPRPGATWGNLMYKLPADNKYLFFSYQGDYVVGARYDKTEISGVTDMIYKLTVLYQKDDDRSAEYVWRYRLNVKTFDTYDQLKKHIATLPETAVVVYQVSCSTFPGDEPLRTKQQRNDLDAFCKERGIVLAVYPAG